MMCGHSWTRRLSTGIRDPRSVSPTFHDGECTQTQVRLSWVKAVMNGRNLRVQNKIVLEVSRRCIELRQLLHLRGESGNPVHRCRSLNVSSQRDSAELSHVRKIPPNGTISLRNGYGQIRGENRGFRTLYDVFLLKWKHRFLADLLSWRCLFITKLPARGDDAGESFSALRGRV